MNNTNKTLLLNSIATAILLCFATNALAAGFSLKDANIGKIKKEKWRCKYCPIPIKTKAKIKVLVNSQSDDNGRFANVTGKQTDDVYADVDGDIEHRKNGLNYRLQAEGLGLDNSKASLLAAKDNSYKLAIKYQNLNDFGHTDALTPFVNPKNSSLELPVDFQRQPTTAEMAIESFNAFSEKLKRQSGQLSAEKIFSKDWLTFVDFQIEDKQGTSITSGNVFTKSVRLPVDIDQQQQQLDLGSYLKFENGSILVNYYQSKFDNKQQALNWQTPYSPVFGDADSGQLGYAPDNQFDQLNLFTNYRTNHLHLQARLIYGQLTQDQTYLPYTSNELLLVEAVQPPSLDGEVINVSGQFKATYISDQKWRLMVNYNYDDRENNTKRNEYLHVLTDSVVLDDTRLNKPYSFNKEQIKLESQWRFTSQSRVTIGGQLIRRERDYQDRRITDEEKYWFKLATRFGPFNQVKLQLSRQFRDGSSYPSTNLSVPEQQSLNTHKFYLADSEREEAKGSLAFNPLVNTQVSVATYFYRNKYNKTDIGLTESKRRGIDISSNTQLSEHLSLSAYVHRQWQDKYSQGTHLHKTVDYLASNEDKSDSAGLSMQAQNLADNKLTLGADFSYSFATAVAEIEQITLATNENYTELKINSQDIKLYADYDFSNKIAFHADLLYQRFEEDDWRAHYQIDQMINVLANGLTNYNYDAYRISTGLSYQF